MDDGICPPWWPNFLWWLLHHPPHNRQPILEEGERERIAEATQHILLGVQTFTTAHFSEGSVRAQVQQQALQHINKGAEALAGLAAKS